MMLCWTAAGTAFAFGTSDAARRSVFLRKDFFPRDIKNRRRNKNSKCKTNKKIRHKTSFIPRRHAAPPETHRLRKELLPDKM